MSVCEWVEIAEVSAYDPPPLLVVLLCERVEMVQGGKYDSPPFPCRLVNRQCMRKKTQTAKKVSTVKSLYLSSIYV